MPTLAATRPRLLIAGQSQPALDAGLVALEVEDSLLGPSACRATLLNWGPVGPGGAPGFLYDDRAVFDLGRTLRVEATIAGESKTLFDGVISALETGLEAGKPPTLTVHAVPRLHLFQSEPRSRSFANLSQSRALKQVADANGLTLDLELHVADRPAPAQRKTSDLAYVLARARALDAEAWVYGDELSLASRRHRAEADASLAYGSTLHSLVGTWGASVAGRVTVGTKPFVTVRGRCEGPSALRAGQRLRLEGVGPLMLGQYYLTRVVHRFDLTAGAACEFEGERVVA
jgi:hypothetical protein